MYTLIPMDNSKMDELDSAKIILYDTIVKLDRLIAKEDK
jgi:hypothetical protein